MARVPVVVENGVSLRPITGERYDAQDQTVVGRTIGAGLQRAGQALSQRAEADNQITALYDEGRAKQLDNEYQTFERDLLFGENGFYKKQNADALNARDPTTQAIDDQIASITARTQNPRERQMLTSVLQRRKQETLNGIGRYAQGQAVSYAKVQSQARIANATDNYVLYADDPDRGPAELATIRSEVASQAAANGLQDAGVIRAMEFDAMSAAHAGVVDNKAINDPLGAAKYLDRHRDEIDPSTQLRLDRQLHPALVERDATGLADLATGTIPLPSQTPDGQPVKGTVPFTVQGLRTLFRTQESSGDYSAVNRDTGALGGFQVMPDTGRALAKRIGVDWRPDLMRQSTPEARAYQDKIGDAAIKDAIDHSGGDPRVAFQYYYGGSNRSKWGAKTRQYGNEMMVRYQGGNPRGGDAGDGGTGGVRGDLGAQLATVERVGADRGLSKEVIDAGKAEVERRYAIGKRVEAEREDTAKDAALESVMSLGDGFTSIRQIPNFNALSPETRLQFSNWAKQNVERQRAVAADAAKPRTNDAKWSVLSDAYASDPKAFLAVRPEQVRGFLDDGDFNTYLGWRRDVLQDVRNGGSGKTPQWTTEKDIRDVARTSLGAAGLRTGESKDAIADAPRVRQFTVSMLDWSRSFKAQNGRLPNSEEIRRQSDRYLIEGTWQTPGRLYGTNATEGYGFEAPNGRMSPKVPNDVRSRILRAAPDATDAEVARIYVQGKGTKW